MNAQVINSQIVKSGLFSRRPIWTDRKGAIVTPKSKGPATLLSSVAWEGYVVEAESNEIVTKIPKKESTDTFAVAPGLRPTDEIRARYLVLVRNDLNDETYQELVQKLASEEWVIANTVHTTRAVS